MVRRPWWYDSASVPADVLAWVDDALLARGVARTGPVHVTHQRPWSLVARVPTDAGLTWLKAPAPSGLHEIDVLEALVGAVPAQVLAPWAADRERGLLLLPDGGPLLGDLVDPPATHRYGVRAETSARPPGVAAARGPAVPLTHTTPARVAVHDPGEPAWSLGFARGLGEMARLQQRTAHLVPDLLAAGVPDMRPGVLVERFDEALEEAARRARGADSAWLRGVVDQVREVRPFVVDEAAELGALAVPPALDHDDLHPWNFFRPVRPGRAPVPLDWGDAVVAHPFCVLLVPLRARRRVQDAEPGVRALRRAYLSPWQDHAPRFELARAADLACRLGSIIRAHAWLRVLRATDEAEGGAAGAPATGPRAGTAAAELAPLLWLRNLTLPSYLGAPASGV